MPRIFEYLDYARFLADSLSAREEGGKPISLRAAARSLACDASFLAKILQGKKPVSKDLADRLGEWLGLGKKENEYFRQLILLRKAKLHSRKRKLLEGLNQMRKAKVPTLAPEQYEFYGKWYYTVVLQLLDCFGFKGEYADLGKRLDPPITAAQARKSIAILSKLGFIKPDETGVYRKTDPVLTSGEEWRSVAIANYQMENMNLARKAFEKQSLSARRFSTLTLSLSAGAAKELMQKLKEFESRCLERAKEDPLPDRVYQFNFQAFAVSRLGEGGEA